MNEYRRIFTDRDRQAWLFVKGEIPYADESAILSNRMMAEALGLRESREGSRYYRRLEEFGLIVTKPVQDPESRRMVRRVYRNDGGVDPGFTQRASMVVVREVNVG